MQNNLEQPINETSFTTAELQQKLEVVEDDNGNIQRIKLPAEESDLKPLLYVAKRIYQVLQRESNATRLDGVVEDLKKGETLRPGAAFGLRIQKEGIYDRDPNDEDAQRIGTRQTLVVQLINGRDYSPLIGEMRTSVEQALNSDMYPNVLEKK